jgi:hypothetical protein
LWHSGEHHFSNFNFTIQTPERSYREVVPIYMDIERRAPRFRAQPHPRPFIRDIYVRSGSGILLQGTSESEIENLSSDNLNFLVSKADDFSKRRSRSAANVPRPMSAIRST